MSQRSDEYGDRQRDDAGSRPVTGEERTTIPRPPDEQVVYRAESEPDVVGARRSGIDWPATIGGALAALGTLVLLSSLLSAILGTIGYQTGVAGQELSVGGLIAGLVVLFVAFLIGGWVAGRMARRRGGLHGLIAALWIVLLAVLLGVLAAVAGARYDVLDRVGLPRWFSPEALAPLAILTGLLALGLMLLGGWLGGRWGERSRSVSGVEVVETRRHVREAPGGIASRERP
ncbi:MAG: YrzE family protein [Actinomycetota bacterium]|nr:YrzE family protein [Actinomycetota bacterium]